MNTLQTKRTKALPLAAMSQTLLPKAGYFSTAGKKADCVLDVSALLSERQSQQERLLGVQNAKTKKMKQRTLESGDKFY